MDLAVFFRNLNLGRANCPTKLQLEAAFLDAGATSAASLLTNGTLVYAASSTDQAQQVFDRAYALLNTRCGLKEPAFVRTVDYLAALVDTDPFAGIDRASVYEFCVSFLHSPDVTPPTLPLASANGNVELIALAPGEVLSVSRKLGASPGSPNAFLEKRLGSPLTTRAWNTVVRLVHKHRAASAA
jgi:uncharacterized protein (DUF1697 family)